MNKNQITVKPKRITIDKLGEMINNGFKEARADLMGVESELSDRIDLLEQRIGGLDGKIDSLEQKMEFNFTGIQNQIDNMAINHTTLQEHNHLKDRVTKVERKLGIK